MCAATFNHQFFLLSKNKKTLEITVWHRIAVITENPLRLEHL